MEVSTVLKEKGKWKPPFHHFDSYFISGKVIEVVAKYPAWKSLSGIISEFLYMMNSVSEVESAISLEPKNLASLLYKFLRTSYDVSSNHFKVESSSEQLTLVMNYSPLRSI